MLANFLNKSKPINFIGLMIFFAVCFLTLNFIDFFNTQLNVNDLLQKIVILLIFISIFFIYNFITSKNNLTYDNSFGFYFFTLLMGCFSTIVDYKMLFFTIIYLLFLRKIYSLQSSKRVLKKLFDAGFWLGILCVFEPKFLLLFLLIYLSAYWHQKITIHTFSVPIIGFLTPVFCYFSYLFWYGNQEILTSMFLKGFSFKMSFFTEEKERIFMMSLLIITFFAAFLKSSKALLINNTFRRSWSLLLINFLVVLSLFFFENDSKNTETLFLVFPISLILANGLELVKKRILIHIFLYLFLFGCSAYLIFL
ncbi:DUF6427 family protein [Polaribacter gangjinensis]|uniref:Beta-carotene 15,15'-monooxygenase n=1 Tax=Polaribacter gangjinensis TaxID=574710 RepID=A0A2S7WDN0_9FLAO|nr:DUF6427 family protein [Polaribacter gangjinensis]PQJ75391.1 hypothetical protein BTO13_09135 [Polaribacter gangjinensis]